MIIRGSTAFAHAAIVKDRSPRALAAQSVLIGAALAATLGACTPSRTYILDAPPMSGSPAQPAVDHRAIVLREVASPVQIDEGVRTHFREKLAEALNDEPALAVADTGTLTLEYRFILLTKGNVPVRVGSGLLNLLGSPFYGLGDGAVGVDVRFVDQTGTTVGQIVSDGAIAGIFGNTDDAAKTAAKSISMYTKANYTLLLPPEDRTGDE